MSGIGELREWAPAYTENLSGVRSMRLLATARMMGIEAVRGLTTGQESLDHLANHVRADLRSGLDALVVVCGTGERGTGTGIGKSSLCFTIAERVAPGWMEAETKTAYQSVTYGGAQLSAFRERSRRDKVELPIACHDEGVFGFLGSETLKPQGRRLLKEIKSCRDDHLCILLAIDDWRILPKWLSRTIPYLVSIPRRGVGVVHTRHIPLNGIKYEYEKEQLGMYPWTSRGEGCDRLRCGARDYSRLSWDQIPEDGPFWTAYMQHKHAQRTLEMDKEGVIATGSDLKARHEGETQQAREEKIIIAMHLLRWEPKNGKGMPGPKCPCGHCDLFSIKPTQEDIRAALKPCGTSLIVVASRRLRILAESEGTPPTKPTAVKVRGKSRRRRDGV